MKWFTEITGSFRVKSGVEQFDFGLIYVLFQYNSISLFALLSEKQICRKEKKPFPPVFWLPAGFRDGNISVVCMLNFEILKFYGYQIILNIYTINNTDVQHKDVLLSSQNYKS